MARAKPLYAVFDQPLRAGWFKDHGGPVPSGAAFKTQTWKPRFVCDLRYMDDASDDDLMAGVRRYYQRRAREPEVIRVSYGTALRLIRDARRLAAQWHTDPSPSPLSPPNPDKLTFMGIRVTL